MAEIKIVPVTTPSQIETVAAIARPIWYDTYEPIIGTAAVQYMIEQFQSVSAISRQLETENYRYVLLQVDGADAGFIGYVPNRQGKLFLSKLYVSAPYRGMGLPRAAFQFLCDTAKAQGLSHIYLTVNKQNAHAIQVYRHFDFYQIDAVVTDIGQGYVMDDYILQKDVH